MWFTDLLVSHNFTRLSREPESSRCSCEGAHFTAVTQPVWEVRDSSTSEPSGGDRRRFRRKHGPTLSGQRTLLPLVRGSHNLTCLSELPEARRWHSGEYEMQLNTFVPVCGKEKNSCSNVVQEMKLKSTKFFHRPHLEPRQVLPSVSLTRVVFTAPVSTSHNRIVWSQDALQTSSLSIQRTEDTASLCPERVMRGVWVRVRGEQCEHFSTHSVKVSLASDHGCLSSRSPEDSPGSGRAAGSSVSSVVCPKVPLFHLPHLWALTTQIGVAAFQRLTFSGH